MKLFVIIIGLIVSAYAINLDPAKIKKSEKDMEFATEYFKGPGTPEASNTTAATLAKDDAALIPVVPSTDVTHHAAVPNVPMAVFTQDAETASEREQRLKSVLAWNRYKSNLYSALGYCQKTHNVSAAVSDQLMNIELAEVGHKEQCYVQCVLEQLGDNVNGTVQKEHMRESVGQIVGMERLNTVLDKCEDIAKDNQCETVYKFFECYRKGMFDLRQAEDKPQTIYAWLVQM